MKWNEVTWYSRLLALVIFFGVVPTIAFYLGVQYGRLSETTESVPPVFDSIVTESNEVPPPLDGTGTESGDTQDPTPPPSAACYRGGCSGQLCTDQPDMVSTCEYREEYACYQNAVCERQASGECGWTETSTLRACLTTASQTSL